MPLEKLANSDLPEYTLHLQRETYRTLSGPPILPIYTFLPISGQK